MNKNQGKKIAFAGCRSNTKDQMRRLIAQGYQIDLLLTISPEDASTLYHISGYEDLRPFAQQHGIPVYHAKDYKLKADEADKEYLLKAGIDLLVVLGWQRIIPKWFLDSLSIGSIGMHGAPEEPPFGRGHSALNWSCIEGRNRFLAYLFFHDWKADNGPIIGTQEFDILPQDSCESLHFKYQHAMGRLLIAHLPAILSGENKGVPQDSAGATYYPARTPEDGLITWNNPAQVIVNLIRGVTDPYPGAFCYLGDKKIIIWAAQIFDTKLTWNAPVGEIVEVFYNGKFVVQTRDYALLVYHYEGVEISADNIGQKLSHQQDAKNKSAA